MRLILALIQPTKLRSVQDALAKIGVERMTVCDGLGYSQQKSKCLLRKVALEIAVNEDFLDKTVETLSQVARSGERGRLGDGKIFVLPLEEVVRLSDAVRGPEAVS